MHFLPDLRAVLNLGLESSESDLKTVFGNNAIQTYKLPTDGSAHYVFNPGIDYREKQNILNKTMDAYLVYNKKLSGFISNFLIQGGYSYQNFRNEGDKDTYRYDMLPD
jgi:iron complex outermembrane receptor protein